MKLLFQRIFKIALICLLIFGVVLVSTTSYFSEDIEKAVTTKIQEGIETTLTLDDVEFTIYKKFPYASVKFTNLLLKSSADFNNDTLLFTKKAYAEISIVDLINKIYTIKSVIITDAKINIQ